MHFTQACYGDNVRVVQAAGAIHTDFERGFICAEVMTYDVLHELKTEHEVKAAGKYRQEGKNYVVQVSSMLFSHCYTRTTIFVSLFDSPAPFGIKTCSLQPCRGYHARQLMQSPDHDFSFFAAPLETVC